MNISKCLQFHRQRKKYYLSKEYHLSISSTIYYLNIIYQDVFYRNHIFTIYVEVIKKRFIILKTESDHLI